MTRFLKGPANGTTLSLRRAPVFLRVVQDAKGKFDALDQLDDIPDSKEKIFIYKQEGTVGSCFVDGKNIRGRFVMAEYHHFTDVAYTDEEVRSNENWQKWVHTTAKKIGLI